MSETLSSQFLEHVMHFSRSRRWFTNDPPFSLDKLSGPLLKEIDNDLIEEGRVGWISGEQFIERCSKLNPTMFYLGDRILHGTIASLASVIDSRNIRVLMIAE